MSEKNIQYVSTDLDDIVFESRNRDYGAYDLRRIYRSYLTRSVLIGTLLFLLVIIIPFVYGNVAETEKEKEVQVSINLKDIYDKPDEIFEEKKREESLPPPPPPPPLVEETVKQEIIKDIIPEPTIAPENEEPPPTIDQKRDTKIGVINQEGVKTTAYTPPKVEGVPGGTGVASVSHTEIYTSVDEDANFLQGGLNSVRIKFQENFDGSEVEGEGTLKTTITFVVERDGSISDVRATGSNSDFNREAERAFKAIRGKWKPGKKNGENVRSRFRFPVTMNFE